MSPGLWLETRDCSTCPAPRLGNGISEDPAGQQRLQGPAQTPSPTPIPPQTPSPGSSGTLWKDQGVTVPAGLLRGCPHMHSHFQSLGDSDSHGRVRFPPKWSSLGRWA